MRSLANLMFVIYSVHAAPVTCPYDSSIEGYIDLKSFNEDTTGSNGSPDQTYILCPNTTFATECDDDDLFIRHHGTTVQCGADGSSQNRCILTRDEGITRSCWFVFVTEGTTNVTLRGLTILGQPRDVKSPLTYTTVANRNNELMFEDCHWKNLTMEPYFSSGVKLLQTLSTNLTLHNCSFTGNAAGNLLYVRGGGMITITNSYARCNEMFRFELIAADLEYDTFTMSDSCFLDNVYETATISMGFRRPADVAINVDFESIFESGSKNFLSRKLCLGINQRDRFGEIECVPFEGTSCSVPVEDDSSCPPLRFTNPPTPAPAPTSSAVMASTILLPLISWMTGLFFLQ